MTQTPLGPLEDRVESDGEARGQGWEQLAQLTGGIPPERIAALTAVRELDQVYPLLHSLAGRSLGDFLVRAAALEAIVAADKAVSSAAELDQILYWLEP